MYENSRRQLFDWRKGNVTRIRERREGIGKKAVTMRLAHYFVRQLNRKLSESQLLYRLYAIHCMTNMHSTNHKKQKTRRAHKKKEPKKLISLE